MAAKSTTQKTASPAKIVKAALANASVSNGYRVEPVAGTDKRVRFVQAPDGHVFVQWNNSKNPKSNLSFGSVERVDVLAGDMATIKKAVAVADEINAGRPTTSLAKKNGVSEGVVLG